MSVQKSGILSLRAVNQYRQRDVFTYLALRYYLDNKAARTDHWAMKFCVDSVIRRSALPYSSVLHFKEMKDGKPTHRQMYFPAAGEALAEAALIDACASSQGGGFAISSSVYSYRPVSPGRVTGMFDHYMDGFRKRHESITEMCKNPEGKIVAFVDIKKFYPSIRKEIASDAWLKACEESNLARPLVDLGFRLLADHSKVAESSSDHGSAILTGPMFSHMIANLVLSHLDRAFSDGEVGYCRYVDDITLVGTPDRVRRARLLLTSMLEEIGLELHDESSGKSMEIAASTWLDGAEDDDEWRQEDSWMKLVGDVKKLLVVRPDLTQQVSLQFSHRGFRMPVLDYSVAAQESAYANRVAGSVNSSSYSGSAPLAAIEQLVDRAAALKVRYSTELERITEAYGTSDGFQAKRLVPKIRYRLGRLAYLSDNGELRSLSEDITDPSLALHGEVVKAIASGRVDRVLQMGRNVAQAVAQPVGMDTNRVVIEKTDLSSAELQALAVFKVNGVEVTSESPIEMAEKNELIRFVERGPDIDMMKSSDPFISNLASLHGLSSSVRHFEILDTPFDALEEIALDALDPAGGSL